MLHIDVNQQKEVFVSSVDVSFKKQINQNSTKEGAFGGANLYNSSQGK